MKIQAKTTILFTTLTITVFLVLVVTVYYFSNEFAYNDFYKRLELRVKLSAKSRFEKDSVSTESFLQIQKEYLETLPEEKFYAIQLQPNGTPVMLMPVKLPQSFLTEVKRAAGGTRYYHVKFVHYAGIFYSVKEGDFVAVESAENSYGSEIIDRLKNILIITLIVATALIYGAGLYFSKRTFRPFRYITSKVQQISELNLHLRLKEQEAEDEVAELITTFNNMLNRLETAFNTQNNFVSHASHELRTPLTAIIAEADYSLSQQRSTEDYRASLTNIIRQAEKLQKLTSGLLSFAQVSFDGKKQSWEPVRLDELLFEVKQTVDGIFPGRVTINLPTMPDDGADISMAGNPDLLKIAIGNIILNGCKYSGEQPVDVTLQTDDQHVIFTIVDRGIGIPPDELRYIYEPFFRASNTGKYQGYGIGMPLSYNIIRMHKGKITVDSEVNQGTRVTVLLPLVH